MSVPMRSRALFGAQQELETSDAMILQDRDVNVGDERVRQKDQSVIARGKPRSSLDGAELQGIEPLPIQSHNLKPDARVVVASG